MRAVGGGNMKAVRMLVRAGASLDLRSLSLCGGTALHVACHYRQTEIAKFLLATGTNANAQTALGFRPLHIAAQLGLLDLVVALLSRGAEVKAKTGAKSTALHRACLFGERAVAELLLDRGAEVDECGENGFLPLHCTVVPAREGLTDHSHVAQLLLSRGANVNATDLGGRTVLHSAAFWGSAKVAKLLLDAGANIHLRDNCTSTALHCTAFRTPPMDRVGVDHQSKLHIAQMLVSRGIDVKALNNEGATALATAETDLPPDAPLRTFLSGVASDRQPVCVVQ
uniref:Uncharacterized protein n=1 Tax=Chromera velia CCMP2878 TaxID=1169474 RepID=A0A0G4HTM1_9ALVE|eukprot:Cvel_8493.t1-p1 / transcript=Cvel_8493.t1 / gene=Cvel_8493 / organism=Chromera_velia_CCMP2878 / gene_product=Ankyrin-2, putative / transcript_product=Ankyrin-2, putative / location=Cvel_scaffold469:61821-62666(+) / protein_length=282 / sequence_SO=supercontig / SO=protein_coding / is_pseudo=false